MLINANLIGQNIRNIRKSHNLSQEAFAEQINTSTRTVSNIETGAVIPSLQALINISECYDCSIESIIRKEN